MMPNPMNSAAGYPKLDAVSKPCSRIHQSTRLRHPMVFGTKSKTSDNGCSVICVEDVLNPIVWCLLVGIAARTGWNIGGL
jgi:hypothetical protein